MYPPELILTEELTRILAWPDEQGSKGHLVIEATAGTGKTTALALLYDALQRRGKTALVLTFSARGEQRFKEQYKRCCQPGISPAALKGCAATFDAFAIRCLRDKSTRKYWKAGSTGRSLNSDDRAYNAMLAAMHTLNANQAERDEETLLGTSYDDVAYCLDVMDNLKISRTFFQRPFCDIDLDEADSFDMETIEYALLGLGLPVWSYRLYTEYEKNRERLDFLRHGDAAYDLAAEPSAIARYLRDHEIAYVLVDEFHDTKAVHFQILTSFAEAGCKVIAVGDRGQDIFEWRGFAPFSAFEQFDARFLDTTHLPLSSTYRFGLPLAKSAGNLLKTIYPESPGIKARAAAHTPIKNINSGTDWTEAAAQLIRKLLDDQVPGSDIAIIVPQGQSAFALSETLHQHKLPYRLDGITPLHLARESLILRAALLIFQWHQPAEFGYLDCRALVLLAGLPRMPEDKADALRDMLTQFNYESSSYDYRPDQCADALALLRMHLGNPSGRCDSETLTHWLDEMGVWKWFYASAANPASIKAMRWSVNRLIGRIAQRGADEFALAMTQLAERYFFNRQRLSDKVVITSAIHCKGNEWRYVILPAAGEHDWYAHFEPGASLQQRRELYVATTRSMQGLFLVKPKAT